ncbi:MAG: adenylate/guanylate cyclase domain-containing protein [Reyranellaceae bacterium]
MAAIVYADVAGYSRLMGEDEEGTVRKLRLLKTDLIVPLISAHGGRIANTAGDSLLLKFASAVDAVRCAIALQEGIPDAQGEAPAERRLEFRIGVHTGDVISEGADLLGDGVNMAARIQGLADTGCVAISEDTYRLVRDRLALEWRDGGEHEVKNIARPVRIWRWSPASATQTLGNSRAPLTLPDKPSIAVLAFDNMSGDAQQEYFSDGITEDIITGLSKTRGIFVIARNSSFAYKGQAIDVTRVGRELGVRYVLEGSVRKSGNRVRITAQLLNAANGSHVWVERFDRDMTDLFEVQDEITRSIVGAVAPEMLAAEMQRARHKDPRNLDGWEHAIRAQWHLARLTREDNDQALSLAMKATELNPASTAGLNIAAFTHIYRVTFGWAQAAEAVGAAYETARRAVLLDELDEVSQTVLAVTELFMGRHDAAIARLRDAVQLNPNFAWAHGNLGLALALSCRCDEADAPFKTAIRLSPRDHFNFLWIYLLGFNAFLAGHYQKALEHVINSLRQNPSSPGSHRLHAACLSKLGRMEEGRAAMSEFLRLVPNASVRGLRAQVPLKIDEYFERYAEALRQVGLPE